jgi:hypothetical protein
MNPFYPNVWAEHCVKPTLFQDLIIWTATSESFSAVKGCGSEMNRELYLLQLNMNLWSKGLGESVGSFFALVEKSLAEAGSSA